MKWNLPKPIKPSTPTKQRSSPIRDTLSADVKSIPEYSYRTHIRIDLQHPERGYSGFILLHKIDSSTQKNLQGCLAYLMNIPDSNSIYMRRIGISTFCFSLKNETLWKFIDIQNDIPFMEISKSHKDNNHLFYTYVWDNIIQNARNDEVQSGSNEQID